MYSVQDCLDALEQGKTLTLWDGATIYKQEDGQYVLDPYLTEDGVVADTDSCLRTSDRFTFFASIALRESTIRGTTEGLNEVDSTVEHYEL